MPRKCYKYFRSREKYYGEFLHVLEGPYIIKSIAGEVTYILEDENRIERGTFYLDNLREHFD